jgi:hypothetical protein
MARTKFVSRISLLLALFVVGALSFWAVGRVKERIAAFSRITLQKVVIAGQINSYQAEGYAHTLQLLHSEAPDDRSTQRAAMYEYRDKTAAALESYRRMLDDNESRRLYQELAKKRVAYHKIREEIVALNDEGKKTESLREAGASLWPAYQEYTRAGDALLEYDITAATATSREILRLCTVAQLMAAVISVIGFVGGVSLPFMTMWLRAAYREDPLRP